MFFKCLKSLIRSISQPDLLLLISGISFLISLPNIRSSHRRCHIKKDFLKKFKKFTGRYLCGSL